MLVEIIKLLIHKYRISLIPYILKLLHGHIYIAAAAGVLCCQLHMASVKRLLISCIDRKLVIRPKVLKYYR